MFICIVSVEWLRLLSINDVYVSRCAFPNTPKFNQVKGDCGDILVWCCCYFGLAIAERGMGVIVRQEWIVDCHKRRTWLPASWYAS